MSDTNQEWLTVCAEPHTVLKIIETQPPLFNDGVVVERYANHRGMIFERHLQPNGVATWYRVQREQP
jgi:hypothetical protein